ncbi:GGDEF domain-containing protein [Bacillus sp. B190/17]|uniref:GGDEF domain-containing protein n=2 Tax=Bacillus lumedeiriae TaxID=3058829 RepID=A0ABW8I7E9_9BACI
MKEQQEKLKLTEEMILLSLHTIDKAYYLFDNEIVLKMKENSDKLVSLYERNPKVEEWDLQALKKELGMDVYIINEYNRIIHSSLQEDVGLDFRLCCKEFSNLLDQRRKGNKFTHDGMDIQQKSGAIKKYSYVPTPDHKYLIELGYSLDDEEIFKQFNFLKVLAELESTYPSIYKIQIYNSEGFLLGEQPVNKKNMEIPSERRKVFNQAAKDDKMEEMEGKWEGFEAYYRYIPYKAIKDRGISTNRVVEIIYNKNELNRLLSEYKRDFIVQTLLILAAAVILSFIIARLVARPMYLAFHDSLTGLKNRAAFEETLKAIVERKSGKPALMMIDLDNFKLVNDRMGHDEGDRLLKMVAQMIQSCVRKGSVSARLGGDEFAVIFADAERERVLAKASSMLFKMNHSIRCKGDSDQIDVTMSIGIAFADDKDDLDMLYKKADIALYQSKEKGKNQYQIYEGFLE